MLKQIKYLSGGAAIALIGVWIVAKLAFAGPLPLPGSGPGPGLGDPLSNLYKIVEAYTMGRGVQVSASLSASQSSGQSNCTQLSQAPQYLVANITGSGTTYICLPTAESGRIQIIWMNTSQTLDIYTSAVSFAPGTADTINTTGGATPYTANTGKKLTICYAYANGAWACGTIS